MPSDPLVTALVPIHDYDPDFLDEALSCLLAQTDPAWRALCVVEPERADEFRLVLARYLADGRIDLVENRGKRLAGAFNTAMRQATTPFVAILLGDDLWASDAVEVLNRDITRWPEVDFFHSSRRVIDDSGRPISKVYHARPHVTLEDFSATSPVKHLLCWRRELGIEAGGMDESLPPVGPDDLDFPWTMAEHGAVFRAVPEALYLYRDHRRAPRLTIDLPLSVHRRTLLAIFAKHGLTGRPARARLRAAERSYLRQCRYRSPVHRRLAELLRLNPTGRREHYS